MQIVNFFLPWIGMEEGTEAVTQLIDLWTNKIQTRAHIKVVIAEMTMTMPILICDISSS